MQYVCLPSDRGRSYILFLIGLQKNMGFAMVYTIISISHQASKQPLKQEKNVWSTQDWGANNRLFQIVVDEHYTYPNQF